MWPEEPRGRRNAWPQSKEKGYDCFSFKAYLEIKGQQHNLPSFLTGASLRGQTLTWETTYDASLLNNKSELIWSQNACKKTSSSLSFVINFQFYRENDLCTRGNFSVMMIA